MSNATNTEAKAPKAKTSKPQYISRGQRKSSAHIAKRTPRVVSSKTDGLTVRAPSVKQAERVGTAMREAFLNIKIAVSGKSDIVDNILNSAKRNTGNNVVGRGWTANLSPRTVRALTEQGVFA